MESSMEVILNCAKICDPCNNLKDVTNAFRHLRTACAFNSECQSIISKNLLIIDSTKNILNKILLVKEMKEELSLCLVVGLQFLGNFIVNNKTNQLQVWSSCQELLDHCLKLDCQKIQHCSLMILYNILLGNPEIISNFTHSFSYIFDLIQREESSEYAAFIVSLLSLNIDYLKKFYEKLIFKHRIIVLNEIQQFIKDGNDIVNVNCIIKFFADEFSKKADWILNAIDKEENELQIIEVLQILDVLILFSCDEKKYLKILQEETSLFINCIALLKATHELSKKEGNNFTMVNKLSELNNLDSDYLNNPVFGFKAALIRLIGNMCWKKRNLQDLVKDFEGVQVILDCCIIDAKNPFIMQWSILAIHNICENNSANQQVIAQMSKEGVVDASKLQELGIVLNKNGKNNSLCIAPVKINN